MVDMAPTIEPKSDQLNSDDLIAGPRTIKITQVKTTGNGEQPIAVRFDGDNGKPYLPCKSMRRVMVALWGADASAYIGRSMTLYRDPAVTWGGMEVGGIRISHMTHIDGPAMVVLTATKKTRKPFKVLPMVLVPSPINTAPPPKVKETPEERARQLISEIEATETEEACENLAERCSKAINYLHGLGMTDLADEVQDTFLRHKQMLKGEEAAA